VSSALSTRIDAKRNRERLVAAARELFASAGVDVSVREIARHAGVGVATLYRNFPTREDLIDAILEDAFDEYVALAEDGLEEADAWQGFTRFIEQALLLHAENRGLRDVVETHAHGREHAAAMRLRIRPLLGELVAKAQVQGTLRSDFAAQDFPLLLWSGDRVIELAAGVAPEVWRRQLGFVLDGLRAEAAHPLPAPPLTDGQLRRVGVAR
jgi:AcrR family transcriptional regulator